MKNLLPIVLITSLIATPAWSAVCTTDSSPLQTSAERFKDNGNGTLTDVQTGMTWMRCALGQTWDGTTCSGKPDGYSWQGAQDEAVKLNKNGGYGSYSDWRVPQIPELAMIGEPKCTDPRINPDLFPENPLSFFWSATPGQGARKGAYMLSFGPEGAEPGDKDDAHFVRLVRSGK